MDGLAEEDGRANSMFALLFTHGNSDVVYIWLHLLVFYFDHDLNLNSNHAVLSNGNIEKV